ncbi:MAG TPA: universal stress protein, partial [Chthoniobacterales bacterium]
TDGSDERGDFVPGLLELKSILVPIDFSEISRSALEYAVPFAKRFGAKITLLHAIAPLPYPSELAFAPNREAFPIQPLEEKLADLAKQAVDSELLNETRVDMGEPFEVISKVARESKVDLIIITTHGYTGLKHVFLGSTAERVVRHAPCPVLVVRSRAT